MGMRIRRNRRSESGAAAVEFALVLGILLTIVFGIVEFGQFYSQYEVYISAAREGARTASVRGTVSDITNRVDDATGPYTRNGGITVSLEGGGGGDPRCDGTPATIGKKVTVSWPQTFSLNLPLVPPINKTLTISGVFACE
jgi:hypothetical protein